MRQIPGGADIDPFESAPSIPKIVAVSLQQTGHLYNFLAGDAALQRGDRVLVEGEAGTRLGTIVIEPHEPAHTLDLTAMRPIVRLAPTTTSASRKRTLRAKHNARRICVKRIRAPTSR